MPLASTPANTKRPLKVSISLNCPKNVKINENIEIKELRNETGTKVYFRISFPRSIVKDVVGDAPKKVIKGMKRLTDSSSSSENSSKEDKSLSRSVLTSREEDSSDKPSKQSSDLDSDINTPPCIKDAKQITSYS